MPFEKLVRKPHQCSMPVGHHRGRYGQGTIWRCPTCQARYELRALDEARTEFRWVLITRPKPKRPARRQLRAYPVVDEPLPPPPKPSQH